MSRVLAATLFALAAVFAAPAARGIAIDPFYSPSYAFTDLGAVPGLPEAYGGLTFKPGDASKIWIGGTANEAGGRIHEVSVVRGVDGHITGFSGTATALAFGAYNDGGVVVGPGGVLFLAQWPENNIGQVLPGGAVEHRIDSGASFGIPLTDSISAMNFVPPGFGGAGKMKVTTWEDGRWFDVNYTPDGAGGYDLSGAVQIDLDLGAAGIQNLPGGPEGFVFIPSGNPLFGVDSILLSEFSSGTVVSYELDAEGNPILSTRRNFVTALDGAEGAVVDPLTGDFLFSTFGTGSDRVIAVQGFTDVAPPLDVPVPGTLLLLAGGLTVLSWTRRLVKPG